MLTACVFSIDDAYVMPFQVFFHSLETTKSIPEKTPLFILHTSSLCPGSIATLRKFLGGYQRAARFLDASDLVPADLPIRSGDHVSAATFYRLFIAEILPGEIDQAVYLDADMLALRSIAPLFTQPVEALIAAADHCAPAEAVRLWGDQGGNYFQAGVLLIPLQTWRLQQMAQRFIEVMRSEQSRIQWWDQDVLNIALCDQWQRLPIWFNACESVVKELPLLQVEESAMLIHFSGSSKPWNCLNASAFNTYWDEAYAAVFGVPFDRQVFLPSRRNRIKTAVSSRLSGLIHGRA
jgi:lipopolysaccharide biosynthesis glycosyltransferase